MVSIYVIALLASAALPSLAQFEFSDYQMPMMNSSYSRLASRGDSLSRKFTNRLNARQDLSCSNTRKPCGKGLTAGCIPVTAVCCNTNTDDYCYAGETCNVGTTVTCQGRPSFSENCGVGTGYKPCVTSCLPSSYECCAGFGGLACSPGEKCGNNNNCCIYEPCGKLCLTKPTDVCCSGNICKTGEKCVDGTCIASTSSTSTSTSSYESSSSSPSSSPPPRGSDSTPAIVGGVVGGVAVLGIGIGLFIFFRTRQKKTPPAVSTVPPSQSTQALMNSSVTSYPASSGTPSVYGAPIWYDFNTVPKDPTGNPLLPRDPNSGMYYAYSSQPSAYGGSAYGGSAYGGSIPPVSPNVAFGNSQLPGYPNSVPLSANSGTGSIGNSSYPERTQSVDANLFIPAGAPPNATAINGFTPNKKDEIAVLAGDPIAVTAMFPDGWAQGMNTRTGLAGAFPATVVQIQDATLIQHVQS